MAKRKSEETDLVKEDINPVETLDFLKEAVDEVKIETPVAAVDSAIELITLPKVVKTVGPVSTNIIKKDNHTFAF